MKKRGSKKRGSTILLYVVLLAGLSLVCYPKLSDWWNSLHQSYAIMNYTDAVTNLSNEEYERILSNASDYNERRKQQGGYKLSEAQRADYISQLDPGGDGIMCTIDIPSINCTLPVYHGTDEAVLQKAVGHLEWTSLPVGGEGTHAVFSGHRGLPSARLLTDIADMVEGDIFRINVLDETLTYEVDQIRIVLPKELEELLPEPGKDLCTLVTCTPYGINTHRLLVRGHRVPNDYLDDPGRVTADAVQLDSMLVALVVALPLLGIMLIVQLRSDRLRKRLLLEDEDEF